MRSPKIKHKPTFLFLKYIISTNQSIFIIFQTILHSAYMGANSHVAFISHSLSVA